MAGSGLAGCRQKLKACVLLCQSLRQATAPQTSQASGLGDLPILLLATAHADVQPSNSVKDNVCVAAGHRSRRAEVRDSRPADCLSDSGGSPDYISCILGCWVWQGVSALPQVCCDRERRVLLLPDARPCSVTLFVMLLKSCFCFIFGERSMLVQPLTEEVLALIPAACAAHGQK